MVNRHFLMKEYFCDQAQYTKELKPISESCGNPVRDVPSYTLNNFDNFPSHKYVDEQGNEHRYAFASKSWSLVDPDVRDPHNYHYAAGN